MKECLLIAPQFHDYYKSICLELKKREIETYFVCDRPKYSMFDIFLMKCAKSHKKQILDKHINKIISDYGQKHIDLVLIILCRDLLPSHIQKLRSVFKQAKFVYYAWDSVKNFPIIKDLANECDTKYSFDRNDCEDYGFSFCPLFYPTDCCSASNKEIDYSCIMSFYPNKAEVLRNTLKAIPAEIRGFKHIFLSSKLYYYFLKIKYRKIMKGYRIDFFSFRTLSLRQCYDFYSKSRVVIDIPLDHQRGLTIRVFEALKMKCKLITTNKDIINYEFYSSDNIFILDETKNNVPVSFFKKPFNEIFCIGNEYSCESFVDRLINSII